MKDCTTFKAKKHIRYDITGGDEEARAFIIPNQTGIPDMKNVLVLTEVSLYIWDMIISECTFLEICNNLYQKYKEDEMKLQKDTSDFVESLIKKDYIYI